MTSERGQSRSSVRAVLDREILASLDDREAAFGAHKLFSKLGAHGLSSSRYSAADGGEDASKSYQLTLSEELGHSNAAATALTVNVQMHMAAPSFAQNSDH